MSVSSSSSSSPSSSASDLSQRIQIQLGSIDRLLMERRASEQAVRDRALRTQTESGTNCGDDACTAPYS
jgi:hypothetical protein